MMIARLFPSYGMKVPSTSIRLCIPQVNNTPRNPLKNERNCYCGKKCLQPFFPFNLDPFMQSSYEWILSSENLQEPRRVRVADRIMSF